MALRMTCTTQVCTTVSGNTLAMASGSPDRLSQQQMRTSRSPRFAQLGEHAVPELGALGPGDPHAQGVLAALDVDADDQVRDLDRDRALVSDLDPDAVDVDDRVDVDLRLELTITIPRHRDRHRPIRRRDRLGRAPVAGVARAGPSRIAVLISDLLGHLGGQRPLDHRLRHLVQQSVGAVDRRARRLVRAGLFGCVPVPRGRSLRRCGRSVAVSWQFSVSR